MVSRNDEGMLLRIHTIPAQLKLLREYAAARELLVAEEYVDVETAKQTGRVSFGQMVDFLRAQARACVVLVEKTDRLYRNLKDWVTLDDLDVEVHFVKEGVVLSRDSRSSEKFMHGIKVLMAKNYIDNLSEETRKGMTEKAEQGIWPSFAPLGYRNVAGADGKRTIEPDPELAPVLARMFERYATGNHSVRDVARLARSEGLAYRRSGNLIPPSTVHKILRTRLYSGDFDWNGRIYKGIHEPIISRELWARAQDVLDGRHARGRLRRKHDFAFSGLVRCGHCGCALVAEIKKGRYVYYHCTGYKGRCPEPYTREEVFEERFTELLRGISFDREVLEWVREALRASHSDERRSHDEAIARLQAEYDRLQTRRGAMYVDKLDGRVDAAFYDRMAAT
jgi:DNA invertase Pin-like site-specific DNA recombinase